MSLHQILRTKKDLRSPCPSPQDDGMGLCGPRQTPDDKGPSGQVGLGYKNLLQASRVEAEEKSCHGCEEARVSDSGQRDPSLHLRLSSLGPRPSVVKEPPATTWPWVLPTTPWASAAPGASLWKLLTDAKGEERQEEL